MGQALILINRAGGHFPRDTNRPNLTAMDDARPTRSNSRYRSGTIEIDAMQRSVLIGGTPAKVGSRAFDVLLALVERRERVVRMVEQMDKEGFGNCTNYYECEAACPKEISVGFIARMNREYLRANLAKRE